MKCRLKSCPVELPEGTHGSKKYCSEVCYKAARKESQRAHNDVSMMDGCDTWAFADSCRILRQAWI